jgi:hypothetical protein
MKQLYLLFSFLLILSSGMAQNKVSYAYDLAGNRISRKVVDLYSNPSHVKKSTDPTPVEDQLGDRKLTVYPNPTRGALAVEITGGDAKDEIRLILFSARGTQLQNLKVTATTTPVNMSSYPAAWYILRVQAGGKVTEFKIVKQ